MRSRAEVNPDPGAPATALPRSLASPPALAALAPLAADGAPRRRVGDAGASRSAVAALNAGAGNRSVARWLQRRPAPAGRRMLARWDSPEHVSLGDTGAGASAPLIILHAHDRDIPNRSGSPSSWPAPFAALHARGTADQRRAMERGLTYGEIVALSGDFYDGWQRLDQAPLREVIELIPLVRGHATTTQLQEVTAGRYLALAERNVAHFSNVPPGRRNVDVWRRMHGEAIAAAIAGDLNRAWLINGSADHFLTDAFSGGHIRTPRAALVGSALGNIESKILHDLDNEYGVEVTNARGDRAWIAYGDEHFFDAGNATNRRLAEEAVRLSRRDVTEAAAGRLPAPTASTAFEAERLVPQPVDMAADRWTGRIPSYDVTPDGGIVRRPDDYTRVRDRVIVREGPGVVAGLFNDDDQVRAWVARNDRRTIGLLPADEKLRMIDTLIGGTFSWISDDDVDAMERILGSVTTESEMQTLRRALEPRALEFSSIGQRTRFRIALARRPRGSVPATAP